MWFFIVAVFLILLLIYKILSPSPRVLEFAEKVPGPKRYSIIGTPAVFTSAKSYLYTITGLYEKYGPVYRIWYGNKVIFVLNDPDDIEVLLSSTKHLENPFTYRQLDSWLGKSSLLTSDADIWRVHRKLLTPSFHFKIVEKSVPMMFKNAKILCDKLESEINQSGFDIQKYLERTALDIIGEIAMGIRIDSQSSVNNDYLNSMKVLSKTLFERFESPWLESETAFKFSKTGRDFFSNLKTVKDEGRKVIHERRKLLQENHKVFDKEENDDGRKKLQPFLDFMLTQATFSDDDIENEVQTFMFAGHDTTKSGMSFCFYCLANHQEIQNKAVEEIREMLLSVEGEPTYNDFLGLKYLEMIIKESMRLYPPAPIISRKIDEDIKLPSGYVLPAGSNADISIFNTHRNAKYFKEPEKFIPERFEERDEERSPYAFIPFSAGPRNCMGQKFAMLEMRIIVAMLLLKYQFVLDENSKPVGVKVGMVLEPMERIPIKIKRRNTVQ